MKRQVPTHLNQETAGGLLLSGQGILLQATQEPALATSGDGIRPTFKGRTLVSFCLVCILKDRRLSVMDPRKGKVGMIRNAEAVLRFQEKSIREKGSQAYLEIYI